MANRALLITGTVTAGVLPFLLGSNPAQAAGQPTVVFAVSCSSNQTTPTASNFCAGLNATQSNPTFGIGTPASGNKNLNQQFAVDLERPNTSIPTSPAYGTRYFWNKTGTPTAPATASTSQTVTNDTNGLFNGVDYTMAPTGSTNGGNNVLRLNYQDRLGTQVITNGTNFTRQLQFTFNPFALGGNTTTCSLCGASNAISTVGAMYGTGSWVGDGNYNVGTGVYSFRSNRTLVNIGGASKGYLTYLASVTIANGIVTSTNGRVILEVAVPSPLPILGGGLAFSMSRRMRRRISLAKA